MKNATAGDTTAPAHAERLDESEYEEIVGGADPCAYAGLIGAFWGPGAALGAYGACDISRPEPAG